ncbi:DUF3558 domain-containing protein [Streptomyces sp. NPDC002845]
MSEGTMHRAAQRVQREMREKHDGHNGHGGRDVRFPRGRHLGRFLAGAVALPVMLVVSGCSSDSDSGSGSGSASSSGDAAQKEAGASASASPSVSAVKTAAYAKLPAEPCKVFSEKTLKDLVPQGVKSGEKGGSADPENLSRCHWDSLDNNGVDGSQFRWLSVSMRLLESDQSRGTGESRAQEFYTQQVGDAQAVEGAKNVKSEPVTGTGDEATAIRYDLKKKEGAFKQQTVVARVENVVITLDYNGAGLAGDKAPSADDLMKAAKAAAKEAVGAVTDANSPESSASPSASASKSTSGRPSASASKNTNKN